MPLSTVDPAVLETLASFDSATVQNAAVVVRGYVPESHDYSGPELRYMSASQRTVVGYAVTSTWMPLHKPARPVVDRYALYDAVAAVGAPVIAVLQDIDMPARRGAIMGDGMAYIMRRLGAVGAVVDGNARDVPGIDESGIGLWATGRAPGHGPFGIVTQGEPVTVAGLHILQGDILVCDGDGVTRVPVDIAAEVARACADVRDKESKRLQYFVAENFSFEAWRKERR